MSPRLISALFVIGLLVSICFAIPHKMNYQGKLTDDLGVGINDTLNMTFRIYDDPTAGTLLWTEAHTDPNDIPVVKGLFDVVLGSLTSIDLDFADDYWLEVEVDGDILDPRVKLLSSPYAYRAAIADSVVGGSGGDGNTLDEAYDEGGPGAGAQIDATDGPVDIRTSLTGPADGEALEVRTDDDIEEALYVYNAGTGPAIFCSGDLRMNGTIWSNSNVTIWLDANHSAGDDMFVVQNDTGLTVFEVNEHGDSRLLGELELVSVTYRPLAGPPTAVEGKVYYNDTDNELYAYDGTTWQPLISGGGPGTSQWTDHATDPYIFANNNDSVQVHDFGEDIALYAQNDLNTGIGKSIIYAYTFGSSAAPTSWAPSDMNSGIKGFVEIGDAYSASIAGFYSGSSAPSAAVVGTYMNGLDELGALGYYNGTDFIGVYGREGAMGTYAGYFEGNFHLEPQDAPGFPMQGDIYSSSVDNNLYYYNGTSWDDLTLGGGGADADWDNLVGYLQPTDANEDVLPNTTGNLGSSTAHWDTLFTNTVWFDNAGLNEFINFSGGDYFFVYAPINDLFAVNNDFVPDWGDSFDLGHSTWQWRNLYVDGVAHLDSIELGGVTRGSWPSGGGIGGGGTVDYIPQWTPDGSTLGDSRISDDGTHYLIGATPALPGNFSVAADDASDYFAIWASNTGGTTTPGTAWTHAGIGGGGLFSNNSGASPKYFAALMGFNWSSAETTAAVVGADNNSSNFGALAYRANSMTYAGYFEGITNVSGSHPYSITSWVGLGEGILNVSNDNLTDRTYGIQSKIPYTSNNFSGAIVGSMYDPSSSSGVMGALGFRNHLGEPVAMWAHDDLSGLTSHAIWAKSSNSDGYAGWFQGNFHLDPQPTAIALEGNLHANSTDNNLYYYDGTSWVDLTAAGGGGVGGSGTLNYIPLWTPDGSTLGDSRLRSNANTIYLNGPTVRTPTFSVYPTSSSNDMGIFGSNSGGTGAAGSAWTWSGFGSVGLLGYNLYGAKYSASILGITQASGDTIGAVVGAIQDGSVYGGLAYYSDGVPYAGYFNGDVDILGGLAVGIDTIPYQVSIADADTGGFLVLGKTTYNENFSGVLAFDEDIKTDVICGFSFVHNGATNALHLTSGCGISEWPQYDTLITWNRDGDLNTIIHHDLTVLGEIDPIAVTYEPQATAPTAVEGKLYYDAGANELRVYDGTSWQSLGGGGGAGLWTDAGTYLWANTNTLARVYDEGQTYGVYYQGSNRYGVYGRTSNATSGASGVYGYTSTSTAGSGYEYGSSISAVKGHCLYGNAYHFGIHGDTYSTDDSPTAGVIGTFTGSTTWGALAYKHTDASLWAGYFNGDVHITGNVTSDGAAGLPGAGFAAYASTATSSSGTDDVTFNTEQYDYAAAYNPTTSTFTAPTNGLYHFDAHARMSALTDGEYIWIGLEVNDNLVRDVTSQTSANTFGLHISADLKLDAGDEVNIAIYYSTAWTTVTGAFNTWFNGHKVY